MDSNTMALEFNHILKNSELNIVCVCDYKYLKYFMTLLKSATLNSPNVNFHICLVNQGRHKNKIKNKARKIFKNDDIFFNERIHAALPLYGIRWVLIILNIFDDNVVSRRLHANKISKAELKEIKKIQLDKADKMLNNILNFNS